MAEDLLRISLSAAVPLKIAELEREGYDGGDWPTRDHDVELVASRSDILLYGGGKSGDVAEVFNALARGLAHLAFAPGGVRFLGLHFEVDRPNAVR